MEDYEQELASKLEKAKRTRDYKINKGLADVKSFFFNILEKKLEQALANGEYAVIVYGYDPNELSTEAVKTLIQLSDEEIIYGDMYIPKVFQPYLNGFVVRYHKTVFDEWRLSFEFIIKG